MQLGKSVENGQLTLISMGQGQEGPAEAVLDKYTKEGGWVFLDNVHLMQGWIPRLERKLEIAAETAHPDFRCFFSAEPINGAPHAKIIPESILQTCIKVREPATTSVCVHTWLLHETSVRMCASAHGHDNVQCWPPSTPAWRTLAHFSMRLRV